MSPARFWTLLLTLTAIALVPLLVAHMPIGVDYPTHLSMVRVMRLWFEDRAQFDAQFGTRLAQPYWGMYLPALALSSVMSVEHACKLTLIAALAAFPIAIARLAPRAGVDRRVALIAIPLMFNSSFYWGLVPFLAGIALALLSLPQVLEFAAHDRPRDFARMVAWAALICIAHASAFIFWALWSGWIVITERARPRPSQLARFAACLAAPLAFMLRWSASVRASGNLAYVLEHPIRHSFVDKLDSFPFVAFGVEPGVDWLLIALTVSALALAWAGDRGDQARRRVLRWGGLAAWMLLAYLILPQDVSGLSGVYQRFLVFAFLFVTLCAARSMRFALPFEVVAIAAIAIVTAFQWVLFHEHDVEIAAARGCLQMARPGSSLAGMMSLRTPPGNKIPLFLHADNFHTLDKLGPVMAHSMTALPTTPVYWKRDPFHGVPPLADWKPVQLDWQRNGQYVEYFLVRDKLYSMPKSASDPIEPDVWFLKEGYAQCRLICAAGPWRLWENTRPTK
jgi:hypothetical protein